MSEINNYQKPPKHDWKTDWAFVIAWWWQVWRKVYGISKLNFVSAWNMRKMYGFWPIRLFQWHMARQLNHPLRLFCRFWFSEGHEILTVPKTLKMAHSKANRSLEDKDSISHIPKTLFKTNFGFFEHQKSIWDHLRPLTQAAPLLQYKIPRKTSSLKIHYGGLTLFQEKAKHYLLQKTFPLARSF